MRIIIISIIVLLYSSAYSDVATFGQGSDEASDTWMIASSPQNNYESNVELRLQRTYNYTNILYWQAVNSVISGKTIDSAFLSLVCWSSANTLDTSCVNAMRGIAYVMTEATWDSAAVDPGGVDWGTDGALSNTIDYYDSYASDDTIKGSGVGTNVWEVTTIVQFWADDTTNNNGFLLRALDVTAGLDRYRSANYGTVGEKPLLTVYYAAPPAGGETPNPRRRKIILGGIDEKNRFDFYIAAHCGWR